MNNSRQLLASTHWLAGGQAKAGGYIKKWSNDDDLPMRLQINYEVYFNERPEYLTPTRSGLSAFDYRKSRALAVLKVIIWFFFVRGPNSSWKEV